MADASADSQWYMRDIILQYTEAAREGAIQHDLKELCMIGIGGILEGKPLPLNQGPVGRWKLKGRISLRPEVEVVDCIVKTGGGQGIGLVRFEPNTLQTTGGHTQRVMAAMDMDLTITWKIVKISSESPVTAAGMDDRYGVLHAQGLLLAMRFEQTGVISHINDAIRYQTMVVKATPQDHKHLPERLTSLGLALQLRFERTGDLPDAAAAISAYQGAIKVTPEGHEHLPGRLANLGNTLQFRFDRTGDLPDLAAAISAQQKAVRLTPSSDPSLPQLLCGLANSFQLCFKRTGDISAINESILAHERAIQLTPEGNVSEFGFLRLPQLLHLLGMALRLRFERNGDLDDLSRAISVHRRAVGLTPEGDISLPQMLNNLGTVLFRLFERAGNLSHITEAIGVLERALNITPPGHVLVPRILTNLASSFMLRFESTGDLTDAAEAIGRQQRAVQLTPDGCSDLAGWLSNLGSVFLRRFGSTGEPPDIHEAVSAFQRAVNITPKGHADLPLWLNNLSNALQCQFDTESHAVILATRISILKRALELTPQGHSLLPNLLHNFGSALNTRFQRYDRLLDINEAISVERKAIMLTPEAHRNLPASFSALGSLLLSRFKRFGNSEDIDEAISACDKAVRLTPEGHVDLPMRLGEHANLLYRRSLLTGDSDDLDASISLHKSAATCIFGNPRSKMTAAQQWALNLYRRNPESPEILPAIDISMRSFASIVGLDRTVQSRFREMQQTSIVALDAAAFACQLGQPDKAVEWLEQGRCFVWNQLSSLRTPLDDLRQRDNVLAERITVVSRRLEGAGTSRESLRMNLTLSEKISVEDEARSHLRLAKEWEELLQSVRALDGLKSFLLPSPFSDLIQHLPSSGPVVVINVDGIRCDAIALLAGSDEPLHISLPNFSLEKAQQYRNKLRTRLQEQGLCARDEETITYDKISGRPIGTFQRSRTRDESNTVRDVLQGLWISVVKPVLDGLGFAKFDSSSGDPQPRIWWCPTGALSFLPIHAAGVYTQLESESILDYAISSYTPTVTALTTRVKKGNSCDKTVSGIFLTSHPNAIVRQPIPGTVREVESIYTSAMKHNVRVSKREGSTITVGECLKHMEEFSSVHLACHASQDPADPLKSRFYLEDNVLDLKTIIGRNLKNADLAFLSACQTSAGEETLSDEAVHLAAGMLAAGYRRVVATMWAIGDSHAERVASVFYQYLWDQRAERSNGGFDGSLSAHALHHAVQQLRLHLGNSEESLLGWIPFVHYGY